MPHTKDALELARQAQAAAQVLWLRGDREDALLRAMSALETTLAIAPASAPIGSRPAALLRAAQLATMDVTASAERDSLVLPMLRAQRRAAQLIVRALESPSERRARRVRGAVVVWCLLVAALSIVLYRPHGLSARASAELARSDYFGAHRAIDADAQTAWLLPDRTTGTLWIDIVPPRDIRAVRMTQPAPSYPARTTSRVRVRLYRGGRAIAQERVSFVPVSAPGHRVARHGAEVVAREREVAIRGRAVTRVEIVVQEWRGLGAGLAEVVLR